MIISERQITQLIIMATEYKFALALLSGSGEITGERLEVISLIGDFLAIISNQQSDELKEIT